MTHALAFIRRRLFVLLFVAGLLPSARAAAAMPDAPMFADYGFRGLTVGLEMGLGIGYISTGPRYRSDEWRKLVLGMGMGALVGMSAGLTLAIVDAANEGVPVGFYLLRDANYGTLFGAAVGAIVGVLLWVDNGSAKDVLKGLSFGTIFGAGAGIAYGAIEAMYSGGPPRGDRGYRLSDSMRLMVSPVPTRGGAGLAAMLTGRFG